MKVLKVLALAALAASARPIAAQMVLQPDPKLDSTQTALRDVLYQLRDTLQQVSAAVASLARDRNLTSNAVLISRARTVAGRCEASSRITAEATGVIARGGRPDPDPKKDRPTFLRALATLRVQMDSCRAEFAGLIKPESVQTLRDYGIGRGERVRQEIEIYDPAVRRYFLAALGSRYRPNLVGAGATPTGQ